MPRQSRLEPSRCAPILTASRPRWAGARGMTLVELLTALAILTLASTMLWPAVDRGLKRMRLRSAGRSLVMSFRRARLQAITTNRQVGIVFDPADAYSWSLYEDGNGNGVRRDDIKRGIDRRIHGPIRVAALNEGVMVGFLALSSIPKIPPEKGPIEDLLHPVQFGSSDIVSFSPSGTSSSGTVYLYFGRERMAGVRLLGTTARARLWEYEPKGSVWSVH